MIAGGYQSTRLTHQTPQNPDLYPLEPLPWVGVQVSEGMGKVHLENPRVTRDDHYLENIVTLNIFNPRMVYNSLVYSNSNRNLFSMTVTFGEQIEEFSLFNTCRSLSPPIFLILVWFTIAMCIQIQIEIYLA